MSLVRRISIPLIGELKAEWSADVIVPYLTHIAASYVGVNVCLTFGGWLRVVVTELVTSAVKLRRDLLVPGLVTTFAGYTIQVFSRPLRPTQPGYSSVRRCNEYILAIVSTTAGEETASSA